MDNPPTALALDADGSLWLADSLSLTVQSPPPLLALQRIGAFSMMLVARVSASHKQPPLVVL
jgi:hypothetical protein